MAYNGLSPVLLWTSTAASSGVAVTICSTSAAQRRIRLDTGWMPHTRLKSSWSGR